MAIIRPKITSESGLGSVEFIALSGRFQRFGQTTREITRPGSNGHSFRVEGKRSDPAGFLAIRDASNAEADALIQLVADFQGSLHTVRDEFNQEHVNVLCRHVELVDERPLGLAVGGLASPSQRLLTWHLILQKTFVAVP